MYRTTFPMIISWLFRILYLVNFVYIVTSEKNVELQIKQENPSFVNYNNFTELKVISNTSYSNQFTVRKEEITPIYTVAIFQAHSQYNNVTVSSTLTPRIDTSVTSVSGGVLMLTNDTKADDLVWYISATAPLNFDFTIQLVAVRYTITDPYPGACNFAFDMENDPNIYLSYGPVITYLEFQPANVGFLKDEEAPVCDLPHSLRNRLTYDLYMYYLPENDLGERSLLDGLRKMTLVDDIVKHGSKIAALTNLDKTQFTVSSREGQGSIYNIVVRDPEYGTSASYVPVYTYSCQFSSNTNTCHISDPVSAKVFGTLIGIVGLFLCFFGHRFFKTEVFIFGFMTFSLAFGLTLKAIGGSGISTISYFVAIPLLGAVGGALCLALWWFVGHWVPTVLLIGLNLGYLLACTIFFTPFGDISAWESDLTFGMCFCCFLLAPNLFFYFGRMLSILTCVVVGGYMVVVAMDAYLHTSLTYIIINNFNRASVPGFNVAYTTAPFQTNDWILAGVWFLLAMLGLAFQSWRERKQPKFPPCPYTQWKEKRGDTALKQVPENVDENTPLLL